MAYYIGLTLISYLHKEGKLENIFSAVGHSNLSRKQTEGHETRHVVVFA